MNHDVWLSFHTFEREYGEDPADEPYHNTKNMAKEKLKTLCINNKP